MATLSLQEARDQFDRLRAWLRDDPEQPLVVTEESGEPAFVMVSWAQFESLIETLDIGGDEALMKHIRRGTQQIEEGETFSWDDARQQLGW